MAGVIPVIFATSDHVLPGADLLGDPDRPVGGRRSGTGSTATCCRPAAAAASRRRLPYILMLGLLVVFFTYFYTAIQFDPERQAETIQRQGGFIPGIRPGRATVRAPRSTC